MGGATPEDTGLASGLINTTYQVGSALGLAVMVSLSASQSVLGTDPVVALLAGYHMAFWGAAISAVIAALVALVWLKGRPLMVDMPLG
jgi:sugar phosphate permease